MKKNILEYKLQLILDFQKEYPLSHVGGSFGLFLLGYDLKRDLNESDIDLITPFFDKSKYTGAEVEETSDSNDFEFKYRKFFGGCCVKHDISIDSKQSYQIVEYNGEKYNVSLLENIIKFKKEYAEKGVFKHKADLIAIQTGVRPIDPATIDDLPFKIEIN